MSVSPKIRMALAGLTAVALMGGVMAADPADAGKKKKKRAKAKSSKVVQVSKGANAKAGNGGAGGAGGRSGNVNNTGNVIGGAAGPAVPVGPGAGLTPAFIDCVNSRLALPGDFIFLFELGTLLCAQFLPPPGLEAFPAFLACLGDPLPGEIFEFFPGAVVRPCLLTDPGPGGPAGAVFSGSGGSGGTGGSGGNAVGGAGGNNSNTSSVTVTRDDHSIDVNG